MSHFGEKSLGYFSIDSLYENVYNTMNEKVKFWLSEGP